MSATQTRMGAPYRYSETLIMLAAALRVGLGIQYRQLEGTVGKMIGESKTPSFSQLRKRMGRLDMGTHRDGMMAVSDPKHSGILAAGATGLKQYNRGLRAVKSRAWGRRGGCVRLASNVRRLYSRCRYSCRRSTMFSKRRCW